MDEFNELLYKLLNRLDAIAVEHPEVDDTAVREEMSRAILNGFCRKVDNYKLPNKFAMFSSNGNIDVLVSLAFFVGNAREVADLDTFHKRLAAFQNTEIVSDGGHGFSWYFGEWDANNFDENGNCLDGCDQEKSERSKTMTNFQGFLKALLNDLDAVNAEALRHADYLATAILNGFLRNQPNYTLPQSTDRDEDVRMAIVGFLMAVRDLAGRDRETLGSFHKRLTVFQDRNTVSDMGHDYEHFFGHLNAEDFDENGKRLDGRDI